MGASDLRVRVDQSKLRCVLDPSLVLGHAGGARLALQLTRVFETWLTRSFWQVVDASELLLQRWPSDSAAQPDAAALGDWIALRDRTDAGSWPMRWVGDNRAESQLQALQSETDGDLFDRYEQLAAALGDFTGQGEMAPLRTDWGYDPVHGALDALALSASLDGALILSRQPEVGLAWPLQALARLDLGDRCHELAPDGSLFEAERQCVRQALANAGLAAPLQALAPLVVVHVLGGADPVWNASGDELPLNPWSQAQAWWYRV